MRKAALHNLGCKVNAYETEAMQELLEKNGYEIVPFGKGADIYIINTCTVTNIADRKSRQMLHRARKMNPDAVVVAAGCYVQTEKKPLDGGIDIVVGNNRKKDIVQILERYFQEKSNGIKEVDDIGRVKEYECLALSRTGEHTRAYIKVQDGCNQFCSYCIIPFARGRVRSRGRADVLEEVSTLAANGYKEVVLTGIHLSSYGIDTGDDLLSLIRGVHEVEGIRRIRLGSLEPGIITGEFVQGIAGLEKVCPHFHLSLQSGCDETLKRMNRKEIGIYFKNKQMIVTNETVYSPQEYYEKCGLLRKYFCNPALTTDIIVGFPGETDEEFECSRAFVDSVDFYETHVFRYSRREGTKAAAMEGQVPEPVKAERSKVLLDMSERKQRAYEDRLAGTVQEVLIEEEAVHNGETYQVGHTKEYVKVGYKTSENLANQIIDVEIESHLQIIH